MAAKRLRLILRKQLAASCGACCNKRLHTPEEWKNHPYAGHGYIKQQGWSHPDLALLAHCHIPQEVIGAACAAEYMRALKPEVVRG